MIVLVLLVQAQAAPLRAVETWHLNVASADSTSITGKGYGSPLSPEGATLSLYSVRAPPPGSFATIIGTMPADSVRDRLVTLSGQVSTTSVSESAMLWLRVDGAGGSLAFKNSSDQPMPGTATSKTISVTLRTNAQAGSLVYGAALRGGGRVDVQHLTVSSVPVRTGPPAPVAKRLLDYVYAAVSMNAYWRDTVTWSVVEPEYWALAGGARTTDEAYPAIQYLLLRLGDHHSSVTSPAGMKALTRSTTSDASPGATPEVRALASGIGYVMVPALGNIEPSTGARFAATIHSGLMHAAPSASCGWIVDLRPNGGGNMWPMLAGLKPFLGSGVLGYFQGPSGENTTPWHAGMGYPAIPAPLTSLETAPVAVLTGPRTASSGEAVTIAFRGRPRTRSFGRATAGLANANSSVNLPDGGMLALMTAVDVDRDGHVYGYKVEPDVIVPDAAPGTDPALDLAMRWLKAEARCR